MGGRAFEHYVFLELIAYKHLTEKMDILYYWRTKEGYEVDFIIQDQAFEVKISDNINVQHLKGLIQFSKEHNFQLNVICCESKKRIIQTKDLEITIWPIAEFLSSL